MQARRRKSLSKVPSGIPSNSSNTIDTPPSPSPSPPSSSPSPPLTRSLRIKTPSVTPLKTTPTHLTTPTFHSLRNGGCLVKRKTRTRKRKSSLIEINQKENEKENLLSVTLQKKTVTFLDEESLNNKEIEEKQEREEEREDSEEIENDCSLIDVVGDSPKDDATLNDNELPSMEEIRGDEERGKEEREEEEICREEEKGGEEQEKDKGKGRGERRGEVREEERKEEICRGKEKGGEESKEQEKDSGEEEKGREERRGEGKEEETEINSRDSYSLRRKKRPYICLTSQNTLKLSSNKIDKVSPQNKRLRKTKEEENEKNEEISENNKDEREEESKEEILPEKSQTKEKVKNKERKEEEEEQKEDICNEEFEVEMETTLLCKTFPGRKKEITTLLSLMGQPTDRVVPAVYVYGLPSTGKTAVIKSILFQTKVPHAYVNMIECYSCRVLFETILNQLSGVLPSFSNNYIGYSKCDNLTDFIHYLRTISSTPDHTPSRDPHRTLSYIVLDNAERLRDMSPSTLLPAVVQLAELTGLNLCIIMISKVVWGKLNYSSTCCKVPLILEFSGYDKEQTITILLKELVHSNSTVYSTSFLTNYLSHIYDIVTPVSKDLNDIRYISNVMFPLYCEPIQNNEITELDTRRLWNNIQPYFKKYLTSLLLRDYESEKLILEHKRIHSSTQISSVSSSIQLPPSVKFLLISSYLASYNPPKSDKKFFSKKKQPKRKHTTALKKEEVKRQLIGPKQFPLDRMMAIYFSITEGSPSSSPSLYSQVATLVSMKYLSPLGTTTESLDTVKYKSLLSFEQVREIAKSVDFEIVRYLHDYNNY